MLHSNDKVIKHKAGLQQAADRVLGDVQPIEFEQAYYAQQDGQAIAA